MKQKTLESDFYFIEIETPPDTSKTQFLSSLHQQISSLFGKSCLNIINIQVMYYSKKNKLAIIAIERRFLTHIYNIMPFIENGARIVKASPYLHTIVSNNRLYCEQLLIRTATK